MARRSIENLRVLLTGASSGIGRALALELSGRGARLLLAARRGDLLESLTAECSQAGNAPHYIAGDIADPDCRRALVERATDLWGALDVLVNNAGTSAHGRFAVSDEPTLRRIMEVNFFAPVELTRAALPLLRRGNSPVVLNIGSILGHRGAPLNSEYSASKFALRGWTEALRAELAAEGIDVLLVSPGTTKSEFFDHLLARREKLPWGESPGISPEAVAKQAVRALERGRREIFPNWRGRALVVANRLAPSLVDRVMNRLARRR
jgi:short-subunit dehydrogenase